MSQLIFEGKQRDLADLFERGRAVATTLAQEHGVTADSNVLVTLEFSDTAIEALIAVWLLKARCVMLPPSCSSTLFGSVLETFSPQAICVDSHNERLRELLPGEATLLGDNADKQVAVARTTSHATDAANASDDTAGELPGTPPDDWHAFLNDQPEVIFFTSGSTSQAKGVVLEWEKILKKGEAVVTHYQLVPGQRVMPILPYSHVYGLYPVLGAFSLGIDTIVCRETIAPGEIAQSITRDEANVVICPPLTAQFLFGRHAPSETVQSQLRVVALGGAAMSPEVLEAIRTNLPHTQLYLSYGLAETYSTICCVDVSAEPECFATVGPARFLAEVEARDPATGESVAAGEIGELCIGGQITSGYYGNEHPREQYFTTDGWLRTGDLGTVDERGYVSIRGRLKETINAGGLSIDPSEIEEVLLAHPLVTDCGVCGLIRNNREFPAAAVVIDTAATAGQNNSESADEAELVKQLFAHCREHLSSKLVPGKIALVDAIPRGALGKIERATLKKRIE